MGQGTHGTELSSETVRAALCRATRAIVIAIGRELGVAAGGEDDDDACPDCRDEIPARCEVCGGCGGLPHGPCSHCNGSSIEPCPTCGGWDGLEPEWWRG